MNRPCTLIACTQICLSRVFNLSRNNYYSVAYELTCRSEELAIGIGGEICVFHGAPGGRVSTCSIYTRDALRRVGTVVYVRRKSGLSALSSSLSSSPCGPVEYTYNLDRSMPSNKADKVHHYPVNA